METAEVLEKIGKIEDFQVGIPLPIVPDRITEVYNAMKNRISISFSVTEQTGPTINVGEEFKFKIVVTNLSPLGFPPRFPNYPLIHFKNIKLEIKGNLIYAKLISASFNNINIPVNNGIATYTFPNELTQGRSFTVDVKMKANSALANNQIENVASTKLWYELDYVDFFKFYKTSAVDINIEP